MICHSCTRAWPDDFLIFDHQGTIKPGMCSGPTRPNARAPNIFDYMATSWDEDVLKDAMMVAEEAIAETMPLSFKFIDQIRHFNCLLYRTGLHYLIGGCNVKYDITPFPKLGTA